MFDGFFHKIRPEGNARAGTGNAFFAQRDKVVIADPDAGGQVRNEAHKPYVAHILGGAGFSSCRPSQTLGVSACPFLNHGLQKAGHQITHLGREDHTAFRHIFFDEPSAGLDPISARLLDDLILELSESLGATVVIVTHELASIFAIGNNSVFLDPEAKTMIAQGDPKKLLAESKNPTVHKFLTRGEG